MSPMTESERQEAVFSGWRVIVAAGMVRCGVRTWLNLDSGERLSEADLLHRLRHKQKDEP